MISVFVELEDLTTKTPEYVTLPCNLDSALDRRHEYMILYCNPEIKMDYAMYFDVFRLNSILEEIERENPNITERFLSTILAASGSSISDDDTVRKLEEGDFFFADISDIRWELNEDEIAARFLATEIRIPFSGDITEDMMNVLIDDAVIDYLNWSDIWRQYEFMGFKLIEDFDSHDYGAYILLWK